MKDHRSGNRGEKCIVANMDKKIDESVTDLPDGFKVTELGPLPEEWDVVRLGNVLVEVDVRAGELVEDTKDLPVLSLTKNDGLILQTERFGKRIATEDVSEYKVVHRGQIVNNPYVIWEGAVHILNKYDTGLVSPVYPVWETLSGRADSWFIDHLLRMPVAIAAYNRFASGAVNRRRAIRKADFLSVEIPLPPLPEQRAIAHVLRTVQRAKEATEQVIQATRELKKSLMRHLFTYGPVSVGEAEKVPLKETEIGLVPGHWEIKILGEVITQAQYGLSQRGSIHHGKYPILRMNNLHYGTVNVYELQYVDLNEQLFLKFRLNKGDLLFNRTNSHELVGKTALFNLPGNYVFASYLIRIVPDIGKLTSEFLNYYLNTESIQARLKLLASRGVSQSNISATKLKSLKIPVPPLPEQREIARILGVVDQKLQAEETKKQALEALFKSLLHNLMTGKIRVTDLTIPETREVV